MLKFAETRCVLLIIAIRAKCSAKRIQFDLNTFFHSTKKSLLTTLFRNSSIHVLG